MITGELRSKIDRIWDTMWSGGISNQLSVIEQLCSLGYAQICDAPVSLISDCEFGNFSHPFYKEFGYRGPESAVGRFSDEIFRRDQTCWYAAPTGIDHS